MRGTLPSGVCSGTVSFAPVSLFVTVSVPTICTHSMLLSPSRMRTK